MNNLTFSIATESTRQLMRNLFVLPKNIGKRQLLIALNAAGGVAKSAALAKVAVETGLLRKSLTVKIFRDKVTKYPRGVLVGPSRKVSSYVRGNKRLSLKRANRLIAAFKEAAVVPAFKLTKGNIRALDAGTGIQFRRPVRYAHLAERKHPAIAAAFSALRGAGFVKMQEKLRQGIAAEAAKLPK